MSRARVSLVGGALIVAVAAVIMLASSRRQQASTDDKLFVVRTWARKDCSVTPWTVAERKGFLGQEGIRLELTGETQPALQIPSILRGDNDVSSFHPNTIAVAKAGGAQITGVAESDIDPPPSADPKYRHMWWYINPEKHPDVHSFQDLARLPGKIKISTITNNICADFETNLLADRVGLPRNRIEWVTMPDIQAIQALKQGLVDASEVHPPFYKGMNDAGAHKIADSLETGLGPAAGITYYVFRDEFIKSHPREVAAFVRAMVRAQKWANEHPAEAIKLTEEAIGVPVTGNHYYSDSLKVNEAYAAPWIADLVAANVIPAGTVTTATLVTHEIAEINEQVARR